MTEVNFNGFKNAGIQVHELYDRAARLKTKVYIFNCELTDDFAGKDFKEFYPVLRKSSNPYNRNFINMEFWKCVEPKENDLPVDVFVINQDRYPVNMENLGVFEKVVNLFKKINETPNYLFRVGKDYLESDDCKSSFIFEPATYNRDNLIKIHKPQNVKSAVKYLSDEITNAVADFLDC